MKLERVAIQEYKQFEGRLVIDGLLPGMNVISGGNEAGKSTIAHAIRTAFVERFKGTTLKEIIPWAKPAGHPRIELTFSVNGAAYQLTKQFFKPRCELNAGGKMFKDDEAEEHLAALIGFARPLKGATRAEHAGIPGLLWVEQGTDQNITASAGHAAQYLRDALAQMAGSEVSAGEDVLISAVERELTLLLTLKQQRPTGVLLEAMTQLNALLEQRAELAKQRDQYEADTDALTLTQAEYDAVLRDKPWEALERKAAAADARVKAVTQLEQRLSQIRELIQSTTAGLSLLLEQETQATTVEASVKTQRSALLAVSGELESAQTAYATASEALLAAQEAQLKATDALTLANAAVQAQDLKGQLATHMAEAERLDAVVAQAIAAELEVGKLEAEASSIRVGAVGIKRLRETSQLLAPLYAKRDAAATRLSYRLDNPVVLNGERIVGEGVLQIGSTQVMVIPGIGELTIDPGVVDMATVFEQIAEYENICADVLKQASVDSLAQAESEYERYTAVSEKLRGQRQLLAVHAPQGVARLNEMATAAREKCAAVEGRLAVLPDITNAPNIVAARNEAQAAAQRLETTRSAQSAAADARSGKAATAKSLEASLKEAEQVVADPLFQEKRQGRQEAIVKKEAAVAVLTEQEKAARAELDSARASGLTEEIERLRTAASNVRAEHQACAGRILTLRSRLETVGATGLGERIAKLDASIEQGERRAAELRLRADALSVLDKLLVEERDKAVEQLRAPLTNRLAHYTKFVFPTSEVGLNDELSPVAFNRTARIDALESLSWGTQGLVGVLTRLAYADLLKDAGRPTLLVFDDVAVHTDAARREGLKAALLDAASRHQILLFTCHPEHWDGLGVTPRPLEMLKAA